MKKILPFNCMESKRNSYKNSTSLVICPYFSKVSTVCARVHAGSSLTRTSRRLGPLQMKLMQQTRVNGWNRCGFKSKIWWKVSQETPVRQGPEGCRQIDHFFTQNFITWSIDGWDVLDAHVPREWFIFIHRSSSAVVFSGIFNKTQTSFAALRFATIPSDRWRRKSAPCHRFFC